MGGVTNDHICLGHLLHHAGLCHPPLDLTDLTLDLRITFRLFVFLLDLLLGHTHLALVVPPLVEKVERRHRHESDDDLQKQRAEPTQNIGAGSGDIHTQIVCEGNQAALEKAIDQIQQDRDLDDALQRFNDTAQGKQTLKALQWIDAAEFRLDALR